MTSSRAPLLFLTHRIPFPPNKGDKVRSFNLMAHLARRYELHLGTFVDAAEDLVHVERLKTWCASVHVERLVPMRARIASLRGMLTGEALSLPYYRRRGMRAWIEAVVAENGIRHALAFSGPMAQYLDRPGLVSAVVDFCDVDSAKWSQYAATRTWPMSWVYAREGRLLGRFERHVARRAAASLFVTEAEAALFRAGAVDEAPVPRVMVMQNGVDHTYFAPDPQRPNPYSGGDGEIVAFSGAMDYWPNVDAVCWFAREVLPTLRARRPNLRFAVVGMNPTPDVLALAGSEVIVTGKVPDVRPWLQHAAVVVAPLRVARGIQNKVLEAMALARPVVVSAESATGLVASGDAVCRVASAPEDFVRYVLELLDAPAQAQAMGARAREHVVHGYGWDAHLAVLDRLFDEAVPVESAAPAQRALQERSA